MNRVHVSAMGTTASSMKNLDTDNSTTGLSRLVAAYPQLPFIAPFMTFLVLMGAGGQLGPDHLPWVYTVRIFASLGVYMLFRQYYPPLGRAHWPLAIVVGLATAVMWVVVHKWFAGQTWYAYTQVLGHDPAPKDFYNPWERLGHGWKVWTFLVVRIGGASTVVPMIEEVFWRAFVLRLIIDHHRFEDVPLGKFTLGSFLICSLASALQHPQWEVGILCWMIFNALFCWKKSLLCLMLTHGITNLALYIYVVRYQDWVFW